MMKLEVVLLLSALPSVAQLDRIPPPNLVSPLTRDPAALEAGQRRFRQLCSSCHGRGGEGGQGEGQGPNLMNSWEVRRAKDAQLFNSVKNGVKGTSMPAFPLPDPQIWELVAMVRSLNSPANSVAVTGSPSSGQTIFFGKGECSGCHMIRGRGGFLGPDLSNIGAARRPSELRAAVLNPKEIPSEGYRPLLLTASNGAHLRAVAKHFSNWSIQALDEKGDIHLLRGPTMASGIFQNKTWMPTDYSSRLTAAEIDSVIAFLATLSIRTESELKSPLKSGEVR